MFSTPNYQRLFLSPIGPTFGKGSVLHKLVLAKDAAKINGTSEYIEECQHPEVLDPNIVLGSIIICTFSAGFYNGTSTLAAIIDTSKALRLEGFILVANPSFGDYIAEPIPFAVSGILIPRVDDAKVQKKDSFSIITIIYFTGTLQPDK